MGVPALFRWLTKKYPKIISHVIEEHPKEIEGVTYPVDTTKPNPNGEEMHNLYLDFNNIVHPCSHPENGPPPANESEMMMEIFKYSDRLVNMVRPRRLLFIAVDGVAPRAKMNQQRSRRFRAAMDAKETDAKKAEFQTLLRQQRQDRGEEETVEEVIKKTWDSNVITPGTPFMFILAQSVRYWAQWKLNTDPAWADLKVIISDASVPGEGEHKVMQFIRSQRSDPEYDPNTRHVMYGLDADLIMLGIATHEPHFRVLREDVEIRDAKVKHCKLCGQQGHYADNCRGEVKEKVGEFDEKGSKPDLKPYVFLNVPILREYLGAELFVPGQSFRFDLERALDDWVFMCFFVGNDFLPHLPSLDIHEDGIDKLIAIWRDNIPVMGGYLTCDGHVDLARAQVILQGLAKQEDAIFRRRREVDQKRERNQKRRQEADQAREAREDARSSKRRRSSPDYTRGGKFDNRAPAVPINAIPASNIQVKVDYNMIVNRGAVDKVLASNKSAAAVLKEQMLAKQKPSTELPNNVTANDSTTELPSSAPGKRKADQLAEDGEAADLGVSNGNTSIEATTPKKRFDPDNPPPDTVKLWEDGYAARYYEQKFHVRPDDIEFRHKVANSYVEGLSWVLLYYYQGCPSWTWYYPYHYAPFAADFVELEKLTITFSKGKPFKPYEQLMGVLPAASNHAIPKPFHPLMTDEDSEIIDFYPEEFDLDLNGKKQSWKAIVLLPFIDEKRLLAAMATKYAQLTEDEVQRNEMGRDALLVSDHNPLYGELAMAFYSKRSKDGAKSIKLPTRMAQLAGMAIKNDDFLPNMDLRGPEEDIRLEPVVDDDRSMNVDFVMPPPTNTHKSMLLPGVKLPQAMLDKSDLAILKSKARVSGRDFGGAPLYDNTRRDPMDHSNRGGRISYQVDRQPIPPNTNGRENPFAAFLDPTFSQGMGAAGGRLPPPQAQLPPYAAREDHRDRYNGYPPSYGVTQDQYSNGYHQNAYGQDAQRNSYPPGGHNGGRQATQEQYHNRPTGGNQNRQQQGYGPRGNDNYRQGGHHQGGYGRR